jgi:hypothetical protein
MKMTENEVIEKLVAYLKNQGWENIQSRKNFEPGIDIEASKNGIQIAIEAKGARGNDKAHNRTRKQFDAGQIKISFGAALVKALTIKSNNPEWLIGIAFPDDLLVRKYTECLIPYLQKLEIRFYWVNSNGTVIEE